MQVVLYLVVPAVPNGYRWAVLGGFPVLVSRAPPRTGLRRCGSKVDIVTWIESEPGDSVTVISAALSSFCAVRAERTRLELTARKNLVSCGARPVSRTCEESR